MRAFLQDSSKAYTPGVGAGYIHTLVLDRLGALPYCTTLIAVWTADLPLSYYHPNPVYSVV